MTEKEQREIAETTGGRGSRPRPGCQYSLRSTLVSGTAQWCKVSQWQSHHESTEIIACSIYNRNKKRHNDMCTCTERRAAYVCNACAPERSLFKCTVCRTKTNNDGLAQRKRVEENMPRDRMDASTFDVKCLVLAVRNTKGGKTKTRKEPRSAGRRVEFRPAHTQKTI